MRSLFSFDVKLKAANRATLHSSGDPSQDSFVMAVWQLTNHQPNESSQRDREFQEQMAVCVYVYVCIYTYIHILRMYIFYMYIHTERYPHTIVLCCMCYFSSCSCQMVCVCTHTSTDTLQIPWTVVSLQCFTQAGKSSFSACVAESEFLPVQSKYLWYFCLREESGFFSFLPSPVSKPGASVEHTQQQKPREE